MFLLDTNDLSVQYRLSNELAELKAEHDYYRHKLRELKQERAAVMGNPTLLEKYAREKYFMKRPKEDIFVIVDQENQPIEK
jgi:cell division protein FtsB